MSQKRNTRERSITFYRQLADSQMNWRTSGPKIFEWSWLLQTLNPNHRSFRNYIELHPQANFKTRAQAVQHAESFIEALGLNFKTIPMFNRFYKDGYP